MRDNTPAATPAEIIAELVSRPLWTPAASTVPPAVQLSLLESDVTLSDYTPAGEQPSMFGEARRDV